MPPDPAAAAARDHLRRAVLLAHRTDFRRALRLSFLFGFIAGILAAASILAAALLWFNLRG